MKQPSVVTEIVKMLTEFHRKIVYQTCSPAIVKCPSEKLSRYRCLPTKVGSRPIDTVVWGNYVNTLYCLQDISKHQCVILIPHVAWCRVTTLKTL